jgi:hypothetical protein
VTALALWREAPVEGVLLGAILQRMIMDGVAIGTPLERALDEAASRHRQVVATSM